MGRRPDPGAGEVMATYLVLPECSRWVVHNMAGGACVRCGWRLRFLLDGAEPVAPEPSTQTFAGPMVVGLRDEDNGPCWLVDATLTPAPTTRLCAVGDEPWPPAIDMITEPIEPTPDGYVTRIVRYDLVS